MNENIITEILVFIAFTGLLVKGWHAVTRDGMLLSFLGFSEESQMVKIDKLEDKKLEEMELISKEANEFLEKVGTTPSTYNKDYKQFKIRTEEVRKKYDELIEREQVEPPRLANAWSECEVCMSSVWGILSFILYSSGAYSYPIIALPFTIIALAGLMSIIGKAKTD